MVPKGLKDFYLKPLTEKNLKINILYVWLKPTITERLKEIRRVEYQTTESAKIMTLFEIASPIERRAALIQELLPSKAD